MLRPHAMKQLWCCSAPFICSRSRRSHTRIQAFSFSGRAERRPSRVLLENEDRDQWRLAPNDQNADDIASKGTNPSTWISSSSLKSYPNAWTDAASNDQTKVKPDTVSELLPAVPRTRQEVAEHVQQLLDKSKLNDAIELLSNIRINLQSCSIWNRVFKYCSKHGRSGEAEACLGRMQKYGIAPNESTFTLLISSLGASKRDNAPELAEVWIERMSAEFGVQPNVYHYNALISVYERAGANTRTVLDRIRSLPFDPTHFMYSAALRCAGREQDSKMVRQLWAEILHRVVTSQEEAKLWQQQRGEHGSISSKLAEKAVQIAHSEGALRQEIRKRKEYAFILDDILVGTFLNALARTASDSSDLWYAIVAIQHLYGLRPKTVERLTQNNEALRDIECMGLSLTTDALDYILRFFGAVNQFRLGREYYETALKQFPNFVPNKAVQDSYAWLGIRQRKERVLALLEKNNSGKRNSV